MNEIPQLKTHHSMAEDSFSIRVEILLEEDQNIFQNLFFCFVFFNKYFTRLFPSGVVAAAAGPLRQLIEIKIIKTIDG